MRKFLLIAATAALTTSGAMAQKGGEMAPTPISVISADQLKQSGGELNIEVQFTPLGGNPIGISGIRGRKFLNANTAVRANVFIGFSNATNKKEGTDELGDIVDLKDVTSQFDITIAPGIEKHFAGTRRLSPYYGAEVLIGFSNSKSEVESSPGVADIITSTTTTGSFTGGLNGVIGMDFYYAKSVYIGVELGFGLAFTALFDQTTEFSTPNTPDNVTPGGSNFDLGPTINSAIRAGFLF